MALRERRWRERAKPIPEAAPVIAMTLCESGDAKVGTGVEARLGV